ncbi:oligosaccharide flippase family protein [Paenibacillus cineris]|uniref:Flippase n=1 Tax=Paenibacillus cineris TaxID=237530 RepID=A0ABQ4L843_9BACL|nr:oligosaccharide flippase family protein [Paenibacillus cineris]GIO52442.1 flippase [Paenibacillus cineris]
MKLKTKFVSFTKNSDSKNVLYSVLSYVITPMILVISTPMLLSNLGSSNYGIWVLINSLINVLGVSNFGLGNAFIKIGSEYEATANNAMFNQLFSISITCSVILAITVNLFTFLFGGYLFPLFFGSTGMTEIMSVTYLVGGIVGIRIINSVVSGSYMAKQRYDINSKVNIAFNLITSITFTVLALFYKDIKILVISMFIFTVLFLFFNICIAKKINSNLSFKPYLFNKIIFKKIFSYGIYSWFQLIISALNAQADKLVIGFLLGPAVLGYYSVCMQLVVKIHEIPTAAAAFLLPKFSSLYESRNLAKIREVYSKAFLYKSIFIVLSFSVAYIFASPILSIWINSEFAHQHVKLFRVLAVSTSIGAFGIIPYYCLNGTGYVKINTVISLTTSLSALILLYFLIPHMGDIGTGVAKLVSVPLVVFSIYLVQRKIFRLNSEQEPNVNVKEFHMKTQ